MEAGEASKCRSAARCLSLGWQRCGGVSRSASVEADRPGVGGSAVAALGPGRPVLEAGGSGGRERVSHSEEEGAGKMLFWWVAGWAEEDSWPAVGRQMKAAAEGRSWFGSREQGTSAEAEEGNDLLVAAP